MSTFNNGFIQSGDGNLADPLHVGRPGRQVIFSSVNPAESYLALYPTIESVPSNFNGTVDIITSTYRATVKGDGITKYTTGVGSIADRPSAALFGVGTWQDGIYSYKCDGSAWSLQTYLPTLKTNSLTKTILAAFKAKIVTAGDTVTNYELDALTEPLDALIRSSVWAKLKVLWVPVGTNATTGAMVPIIGANFTAVNMVSGDYDSVLGITGDAVSKYVNTNFNPTGNVTASDWGYGGFIQNTTKSGVVAGTLTGNTNFISLAASGAYINTVAVGGLGQLPGLCAAQVATTVVNGWNGGYKSVEAAYSTGTLPNVALTLLSANGASFSNQSICGFAVWSPALTADEFLILSNFFRAANLALWRTKFTINLVCVGDSNTVGTGTGVTTANRWSKLLSTSLLLTESNQGVSGTAMSDNHNAVVSAGGDWVTARKIASSSALAPNLLVSALGTNDAQSAVSIADFSSDYETWLNYQLSYGVSPSQIILTSPVASTIALINQPLLQQFRTVIQNLAIKYKTGYFDAWLHTSTHTVDWFQSDLLHLNAAGHAGFAQGLLDYIASSRQVSAINSTPWE
jgi:lysophospholipase L1-like esterase